MPARTHLGTDPLSWIGDGKEGKSKQGKQIKPKVRPTVERGLPSGWTRATIIVHKDHLEKLKALAYWTPGATIKELVHEALTKYLKGKKAKPIPKERGSL